LELDAYSRHRHALPAEPGDEPTLWSVPLRTLEDLTSPGVGLLSAQARPQSYRNDQTLATFAASYGRDEENRDLVEILRFTNDGRAPGSGSGTSGDADEDRGEPRPPSLSWILTRVERRQIRTTAEHRVTGVKDTVTEFLSRR
ncbi:MAG: hypothetical protein AAFP86_17635, partial [Planctomycetota bacterium]